MAERGVLWALTVLFLIGAAGRWQGPAGMIEALGREETIAPENMTAEGKDIASELEIILDQLGPDESAAFLAALPDGTARALLQTLPEERRAALAERQR
jgi:hypothetical protein